MTDRTTHIPAVAGTVAAVASVIAADVWAAHTDRPTISSAFATALEHPIGGPAAAAVLAAVLWHLALDPIIRRLEQHP